MKTQNRRTKKTFTSKWSVILMLPLLISFVGCSPKESETTGNYEKGILILNEGLFNSGTADITHYLNNITQQNVFSQTNNRPLGDIGQSMTYYDGKYYIVVNNSNKIEVVDMDFVSIAAFENLTLPRYIQFANGKGYVSSWANDGQVYVIEPATGAVLKTISTDPGSEKMLLHDNMLYVANSGGFGSSNTISIINTNTDSVEVTLEVGSNPIDLVIDTQRNLWVLLAGQYDASWTEVEGAGLVKIAPQTNQILETIAFESSTGTANSLCTNGQDLFYNYNGGIHKMSIDATIAPSAPAISGQFYKLYLNASKLYACDAGDYSTPGKVLIYNQTEQLATDTIHAGIIPSYILFRN
ncbi:MAG: hypothetical protein PHU27_09925 [Salinivirgaceae bacterium]|nr:hypothetical protein [Salinivirgaceae bacterium]